jgi:hypothetical protein
MDSGGAIGDEIAKKRSRKGCCFFKIERRDEGAVRSILEKVKKFNMLFKFVFILA